MLNDLATFALRDVRARQIFFGPRALVKIQMANRKSRLPASGEFVVAITKSCVNTATAF